MHKPEHMRQKKEVGKSALFLLVSVFLLAGVTLAWFTMNKVPSMAGPSLTAKTSFIPFKLYRLVEEAQAGTSSGATSEPAVIIDGKTYVWVPVKNIDFSRAVPNQTERYLAVLEDTSQKADTLLLQIEELKTGDYEADGDDLLDYFYFQEPPAADQPLTTYTDRAAALKFRTCEVRHDTVLGGVKCPFEKADNRLLFDIYFDKDACIYYQNAGLTGEARLELEGAESPSSAA